MLSMGALCGCPSQGSAPALSANGFVTGVATARRYAMLSDIFPTGRHGTDLADMQPGDRVAVFGAGPVGLLAAHSAMICGASQVFVPQDANPTGR